MDIISTEDQKIIAVCRRPIRTIEIALKFKRCHAWAYQKIAMLELRGYLYRQKKGTNVFYVTSGKYDDDLQTGVLQREMDEILSAKPEAT